MIATKMFFANETELPVYLLLRAQKGTLEIHVYDTPVSNAQRVNPNSELVVEVNDLIRSCIHGGKLDCWFRGHRQHKKPDMMFVPGALRRPEGPVFQIVSLKN